jgi:hypothetical protein
LPYFLPCISSLPAWQERPIFSALVFDNEGVP